MKQRFGVFATLVFAGVFVSLTTCQTTFFCHVPTQSVPDLEPHRNSLPLSATAGPSQSSRIRLTQSATGIVRIGPAFPTRPLPNHPSAVAGTRQSTRPGEAPVLDTSDFTITIHVYNYAAVPEKTLARAKDEGGRIFRYAGLTALWVDHSVKGAGDRRHPQDSSDSWSNTHFVLRLLTQSRERLAKYAMGEALSFRIANVFMNRVTEQLTVGELSAGQVLGHAIVHEIGHHLLGDNSHAPHGIMVAKWSKQHLQRISKGDLLFTQQEVKRIQDEVKHRSHSAVRVAD